MANVKVAVRARPLSKREADEDDAIIIDIKDDTVSITNLKVPEQQEGDSRDRVRHFVFDFCYNSMYPENENYVSQAMIYQDVGTEVLEAVFDGYNACVLAYGQSGSGKTHSMMGTEEEPGLTPRICEGLFSRIDDVLAEEQVSFRTNVSFLEIYNERVRDLLQGGTSSKPRYTLKVREHPKLGPYVQDLSQHTVNDVTSLMTLVSEGNANRSTASTEANHRSSRSHAIFTVTFGQAKMDGDLPAEVTSRVHLVDLAGSERANQEQCKERLKEGANINKSLVTLGTVISSLAERSVTEGSLNSLTGSTQSLSGTTSCGSSPSTSPRRSWQPFVPYRDSVLTWLLKDSLGGNSKTVMIATISPSSSCYNETLNTLRYAKRTKCIVNQPIVNEDPNVRIIRELRDEVTRLRNMLAAIQINGSLSNYGPNGNVLLDLLRENESRAKELTRDWVSKWHNNEEAGGEKPEDLAELFVVGSTQHYKGPQSFVLQRDRSTSVGNCVSREPADILLPGEDIQELHCVFSPVHDQVVLQAKEGAHCFMGGNRLMFPTLLSDGDVIQLGKSFCFKFSYPGSTWRNTLSESAGPPVPFRLHEAEDNYVETETITNSLDPDHPLEVSIKMENGEVTSQLNSSEEVSESVYANVSATQEVISESTPSVSQAANVNGHVEGPASPSVPENCKPDTSHNLETNEELIPTMEVESAVNGDETSKTCENGNSETQDAPSSCDVKQGSLPVNSDVHSASSDNPSNSSVLKCFGSDVSLNSSCSVDSQKSVDTKVQSGENTTQVSKMKQDPNSKVQDKLQTNKAANSTKKNISLNTIGVLGAKSISQSNLPENSVSNRASGTRNPLGTSKSSPGVKAKGNPKTTSSLTDVKSASKSQPDNQSSISRRKSSIVSDSSATLKKQATLPVRTSQVKSPSAVEKKSTGAFDRKTTSGIGKNAPGIANKTAATSSTGESGRRTPVGKTLPTAKKLADSDDKILQRKLSTSSDVSDTSKDFPDTQSKDSSRKNSSSSDILDSDSQTKRKRDSPRGSKVSIADNVTKRLYTVRKKPSAEPPKPAKPEPTPPSTINNSGAKEDPLSGVQPKLRLFELSKQILMNAQKSKKHKNPEVEIQTDMTSKDFDTKEVAVETEPEPCQKSIIIRSEMGSSPSSFNHGLSNKIISSEVFIPESKLCVLECIQKAPGGPEVKLSLSSEKLNGDKPSEASGTTESQNVNSVQNGKTECVIEVTHNRSMPLFSSRNNGMGDEYFSDDSLDGTESDSDPNRNVFVDENLDSDSLDEFEGNSELKQLANMSRMFKAKAVAYEKIVKAQKRRKAQHLKRKQVERAHTGTDAKRCDYFMLNINTCSQSTDACYTTGNNNQLLEERNSNSDFSSTENIKDSTNRKEKGTNEKALNEELEIHSKECQTSTNRNEFVINVNSVDPCGRKNNVTISKDASNSCSLQSGDSSSGGKRVIEFEYNPNPRLRFLHEEHNQNKNFLLTTVPNTISSREIRNRDETMHSKFPTENTLDLDKSNSSPDHTESFVLAHENRIPNPIMTLFNGLPCSNSDSEGSQETLSKDNTYDNGLLSKPESLSDFSSYESLGKNSKNAIDQLSVVTDATSSENSFTSPCGSDMTCSSETSSDDFVYCEPFSEGKVVPCRADQMPMLLQPDRQLYTIVENSEQSDIDSSLSRSNTPQSSLTPTSGTPIKSKNNGPSKDAKTDSSSLDIISSAVTDEYVLNLSQPANNRCEHSSPVVPESQQSDASNSCSDPNSSAHNKMEKDDSLRSGSLRKEHPNTDRSEVINNCGSENNNNGDASQSFAQEQSSTSSYHPETVPKMILENETGENINIDDHLNNNTNFHETFRKSKTNCSNGPPLKQESFNVKVDEEDKISPSPLSYFPLQASQKSKTIPSNKPRCKNMSEIQKLASIHRSVESLLSQLLNKGSNYDNPNLQRTVGGIPEKLAAEDAGRSAPKLFELYQSKKIAACSDKPQQPSTGSNRNLFYDKDFNQVKKRSDTTLESNYWMKSNNICTWGDPKLSTVQRQFLNVNILSPSRHVPVSIDSQLFGDKVSRIKTFHGSDTFPPSTASEDSITFVFVGPARRTPVLMELIRRSLRPTQAMGSGSSADLSSSDTGTNAPSPKAKQYNIYASSKKKPHKLQRSISLDTAMVALTKFVKLQRKRDITRTYSLDTLVPEEFQVILEQGRLHSIADCKQKGRNSPINYDNANSEFLNDSSIDTDDDFFDSQPPTLPRKTVCDDRTRDEETLADNFVNSTTGSQHWKELESLILGKTPDNRQSGTTDFQMSTSSSSKSGNEESADKGKKKTVSWTDLRGCGKLHIEVSDSPNASNQDINPSVVSSHKPKPIIKRTGIETGISTLATLTPHPLEISNENVSCSIKKSNVEVQDTDRSTNTAFQPVFKNDNFTMTLPKEILNRTRNICDNITVGEQVDAATQVNNLPECVTSRQCYSEPSTPSKESTASKLVTSILNRIGNSNKTGCAERTNLSTDSTGSSSSNDCSTDRGYRKRVRFAPPQRSWSMMDMSDIIAQARKSSSVIKDKASDNLSAITTFLEEATTLLKSLNEISVLLEKKYPMCPKIQRNKLKLQHAMNVFNNVHADFEEMDSAGMFIGHARVQKSDSFEEKAVQTDLTKHNHKVQTDPQFSVCNDDDSLCSDEDSSDPEQQTSSPQFTSNGATSLRPRNTIPSRFLPNPVIDKYLITRDSDYPRILETESSGRMVKPNNLSRYSERDRRFGRNARRRHFSPSKVKDLYFEESETDISVGSWRDEFNHKSKGSSSELEDCTSTIVTSRRYMYFEPSIYEKKIEESCVRLQKKIEESRRRWNHSLSSRSQPWNRSRTSSLTSSQPIRSLNSGGISLRNLDCSSDHCGQSQLESSCACARNHCRQHKPYSSSCQNLDNLCADHGTSLPSECHSQKRPTDRDWYGSAPQLNMREMRDSPRSPTRSTSCHGLSHFVGNISSPRHLVKHQSHHSSTSPLASPRLVATRQSITHHSMNIHSPRAYMQHLVGLRREIVRATMVDKDGDGGLTCDAADHLSLSSQTLKYT